MHSRAQGDVFVPVAVLLAAFLLIPLSQLQNLTRIPGDLGDGNLNNYFLEYTWQFVTDNASSLWNLPFFYPYPYVLGFSENLFGLAPVYWGFRAANVQPDTAFQLWFLVGYLLNFLAAFIALKMLGATRAGAVFGAIIFAFALPVTARAGHAQLIHRFAIPLTIAFFVKFLERKQPLDFAVAGFFLTWQFFVGIYIGFFTLLLVLMMTAFFVVRSLFRGVLRLETAKFLGGLSHLSQQKRILLASALAAEVVALFFLFYPYLKVQSLYSAHRSWQEVVLTLPQVQSYFSASESNIWSKYITPWLADLPMRHEHQMFAGLSTYLMAGFGLLTGFRARGQSNAFVLIAGTLAFTIVATLNVGGVSLWRLFYWLPLASAIRVMTRVDLAILFPLAFLASVGIDYIARSGRKGVVLTVLIGVITVAEFSASTMPSTLKADWRAARQSKNVDLPAILPSDAIIFQAQRPDQVWYQEETNAMWVGLTRHTPTLNGYSGLTPLGFSLTYGQDCLEAVRRLLSWLEFSGKAGDEVTYRSLASRLVMSGFDECPVGWLAGFPKRTSVQDPVPVELLSGIRLETGPITVTNSGYRLTVTVMNSGTLPVPAIASGQPTLRLSWRFVTADGIPLMGFDPRRDVGLDIAAGSALPLILNIPRSDDPRAKALQVSWVQEGLFWGHDIGIELLNIPLPSG